MNVQHAEEFALGEPDAGAWLELLFQEHYARIVSMLIRLTGDRGQAEEIAADVFCKLSRRSRLRRDDGGKTGWIYRVAMNAGLDALRSNARRRRREEAAGAEDARAATSDDPLEGMVQRERRLQVRSVLGAMKPRDAQLLLLRASGLAYRECADTLGIQPGSVGTLLARAEAEFERRYRARYGENV